MADDDYVSEMEGQDFNLTVLLSLPIGSGTGCLMTANERAPSGLPLPPYEYSCKPGFYCPNINSSVPSSLPTLCVPTPQCEFKRLNGMLCESQGRYEPVICSEGNYCPTFLEQYVCPEGHYCPRGSIMPRKCYPFSSCREGIAKQSFYGGLVLCLVLDLLLILIIFVKNVNEAKKANLPWITVLPERIKNIIYKFQKPGKLLSKKDKLGIKGADSQVFNSASMVSLLVTENEQRLQMNSLISFFSKELEGSPCFLNFQFDKLELRLKNGKHILEGVSGKVQASRLLAIMGPSGAGKTTFMNVLMGKVQRTSGNLLVSNKKIEIHALKKVIGYVPQDDIMLRELSVRENILHAAKIRLSATTWKIKEIEAFVDNLIEVLGLSHVAHTPIGDETQRGISGGQRKRVNIAMELASIPLALFLDEPTSGLDSTASLKIANLLKSLTTLGITIVSVIHQPRIEIFNKFDDVLLLIPGGKTAYLGPVNQVLRYFEKLGYVFQSQLNPADVLMDILSGKGDDQNVRYTPQELAEIWETKGVSTIQIPVLQTDISEEKIHERIQRLLVKKGAYWYSQIFHNLIRSLLQQSRQTGSFLLELFVGSVAGLFMGIAMDEKFELYTGVWRQPYTALTPSPIHWLASSYGLLIGMSCGLAAAPSGVKVFGDETPVFWREAAVGHNRISYYIAKTLSVFPRFLLASLHFASVYYYVGKPLVPFNIQYLLIALQFFGVYGLSVCVSLVTKRQDSALLAVIVSLICAVLCGFGPSLDQAKAWGASFIWDLMFNRWAAEAQYSEAILPYKHVYYVKFSADLYGYTLNRTGFNLLMMILIGLGWRLIGFVLLISMNRDKQR